MRQRKEDQMWEKDMKPQRHKTTEEQKIHIYVLHRNTVVPVKTVASEVCGLYRVTGSLNLERHDTFQKTKVENKYLWRKRNL